MIALPTLSQLDGAAATRIWLAVAPAEMRCAIDRLAEMSVTFLPDDPAAEPVRGQPFFAGTGGGTGPRGSGTRRSSRRFVWRWSCCG